MSSALKTSALLPQQPSSKSCYNQHTTMESTGRMAWSPWVRTSLVVGVLACLCFSAGEGLRLTPLPVPPLDEAGASELEAKVTHSRGTLLNRTGPLHAPAQGHVHKRSKRQALDCVCPPSGSEHEIPFSLLRRPSDGHQIPPGARLAGARPPGRAPPLTS